MGGAIIALPFVVREGGGCRARRELCERLKGENSRSAGMVKGDAICSATIDDVLTGPEAVL